MIGEHVRDKRTGIDGTCVAITEWEHRPREIAIARRGVNKDGLAWDLFWVDEQRIEQAP